MNTTLAALSVSPAPGLPLWVQIMGLACTAVGLLGLIVGIARHGLTLTIAGTIVMLVGIGTALAFPTASPTTSAVSDTIETPPWYDGIDHALLLAVDAPAHTTT